MRTLSGNPKSYRVPSPPRSSGGPAPRERSGLDHRRAADQGDRNRVNRVRLERRRREAGGGGSGVRRGDGRRRGGGFGGARRGLGRGRGGPEFRQSVLGWQQDDREDHAEA